MEPPAAAELVELLLDGARYGDLEDVQLALQNKVDVNSTDEFGKTAMHMACANGNLEVLETLLKAGSDVEPKNQQGNTPLHWACLCGHEQVVRRLLTAGASPSALNSAGRTPVDEALSRGFEAVLEVIQSFDQSVPEPEQDATFDVEEDDEEAADKT